MEQANTPLGQVEVSTKAALDHSFKVRGVATAIGSGFFYGQYTAFMTLGMALGIWQFWYGADSGLSSFAVVFFLSALGSALIDSFSGLWAFSICTARGKFQDLFRCLKTKPGAIMVVAAIIGGPIASTAYVVGLQQAGSIVVPISALCAAFGAIISRFLFKQALTPRIMLGIAICFGASFIIGYSGLGLQNQSNVPLGLAFGFLAALCWGIEGCICGYGTSLIDPEIGITFRQCTSGLVNLLFLVPIFAIFADVNPVEMVGAALTDVESSKWFIIGGFVAYLNFMLWYKGNGMCGTALGMACNGMFAFWGPFFCWLVLGVGFGIEGWNMSLTAWGAALLMVFGIFILSMNPLDLLKSKKDNTSKLIPLNYAILRHFTTVNEASVDDVMKALKDEYGTFSAFTRFSLLNAIMVSEKNAILEENRFELFELDGNNEIRVYYKITESGTDMVTAYVKD